MSTHIEIPDPVISIECWHTFSDGEGAIAATLSVGRHEVMERSFSAHADMVYDFDQARDRIASEFAKNLRRVLGEPTP